MKPKQIDFLRAALAFFFMAAGTLHFLRAPFYLKIMPGYIPYPETMVYLSGLMEIILGGLILVPAARKIAAAGLILLLIAVFPANVNMALHPEILSSIPAWAGWIRLPFQGLFIWWVIKCG